MLRQIARSILPKILPSLWTRLRTLNLNQTIKTFVPRTVEHTYGGIKLCIELRDPLAEDWYDRNWEELAEIAFLKSKRLREGARVFDLGAHYGVVALMLAEVVGSTGQVIAVEGTPHNAAAAERNRQLNGASQLTVVQGAISDKPGELEFCADFNGTAVIGNARNKIKVPAFTVDDLSKKYGYPDVLFFDIEGFEVRALQGAANTLLRKPDCFIEVHVGVGLEDAGGSVAKLVSFFPTKDYELLMLDPEINDAWQLAPFDENSELVKRRFYLLATER